MDAHKQLVEFARRIAIYREYATDETGLQDLETLNAKFEHEEQEFAEAVATGNKLKILHEGADLLYYSACISYRVLKEQGDPLPYYFYFSERAKIRDVLTKNGTPLHHRKIEDAALAKYVWRAGAPNSKNETYELHLIEEAIK